MAFRQYKGIQYRIEETKKCWKYKKFIAVQRGGERRPGGPDGSSLARMDADCYLVLGGAG